MEVVKIYCVKCGTKNDDKAVLCKKCGEPLGVYRYNPDLIPPHVHNKIGIVGITTIVIIIIAIVLFIIYY